MSGALQCRHKTPSIEQALKNGKKVKILAISPVYKQMHEVEGLVNTSKLREDIPRTLDALERLNISAESDYNYS
jgi:hypothetical protein